MYKDQNNNNNDNNSSAYIAQYHRHKGSLGALYNILLPVHLTRQYELFKIT